MAPPTGTVPPTLPPSVEEAYRRKCIQLKQRMNDVDESNDAARLRITRVGREIEKLRLERAFLLENLAKRTSTNVEDSEGSPSPPPTPKEKPLRTKRGHRKPSFMNNLAEGRLGGGFPQQGTNTLSPASETFSHRDVSNAPIHGTSQASFQQRPLPGSNGYGASIGQSNSPPPQRRPKNAFDLYCNEMRPALMLSKRSELATGTYDIERALAEGWQGLSSQEKAAIQEKFEYSRRILEADRDAAARTAEYDSERNTPDHLPSASQPADDQDVEMAEEGGSVAEVGDTDGGITAVNRE